MPFHKVDTLGAVHENSSCEEGLESGSQKEPHKSTHAIYPPPPFNKGGNWGPQGSRDICLPYELISNRAWLLLLIQRWILLCFVHFTTLRVRGVDKFQGRW